LCDINLQNYAEFENGYAVVVGLRRWIYGPILIDFDFVIGLLCAFAKNIWLCIYFCRLPPY
jgi:hypothetical protein